MVTSTISDCDKEALLNYDGYNVGVLAPCVTLPLTLAMIVLPYCWYVLLIRKDDQKNRNNKNNTDLLYGADLLLHTFFAVCCWIQCIAKLVSKEYAGGITLCEFQGWYVGFYVYSEMLLGGCALNLLIMINGKEGGGEENVMNIGMKIRNILMKRTKEFIIATYIFGAFMASLPFMGVGYYTFGSVFCTIDLVQSIAFQVVFIILFIFILVSVALGPARTMLLLSSRNTTTANGTTAKKGNDDGVVDAEAAPEKKSNNDIRKNTCRHRRRLQLLCLFAIAFTVIGWSIAFLMVLMGLIGNNDNEEDDDSSKSCDDRRHSTFGDATGLIYGLYVILAHSQNLIHPILHGIYIRRSSSLLSDTKEKEEKEEESSCHEYEEGKEEKA